MVPGGLQLYGGKQLPVEIALGIDSWWLYSYMSSINYPNHHTECWTSSQVTLCSTHFFQLVTSGEVHSLPQDDDCFSYPVHNVMDCGPWDIKGCRASSI